MSYTPERICQLALSKLGSSIILGSLSSPSTPQAKYMALKYPHVRDVELAKRRWTFAMSIDVPLTRLSPDGNPGDRVYRFSLPTDCLKVWRRRGDRWRVVGSELRDWGQSVTIDYTRRVDDADLDVLFVETLACKLAIESCEYITQSNTKMQTAIGLYKDALRDAASANAYEIGAEDASPVDDDFTWLAGRTTSF